MNATAKIGAFTLAVLLLLGALVLKIEDLPIGRAARTSSAEVHFQDVAGLDDKSAVRIAGVRVGKVDGIRLLPDGTAVARLALDREVVLRQGAYGQIRNLGLLGDKYIELFPGPLASARLPAGARIEGSVPTGFDELTKLAKDIGKDVKELTGALSSSLGGDEGSKKINRIVDNVGQLAEALRKLVDANRDNVDVTLANLKEFSGAIRETLARLDRILDENRAGVKGSVQNIDELSGKLKTTADNLNSITGKIDTGQGTIGALVNDDKTVKNLNDTLGSIKTGVDSLNTTLTRINRIELDLGFRGEYLSRPGSSKAYFTVDVVPRENKFYRFEIASLPGGRRKDTSWSSTFTGPDGKPQTSSATTTTYEDEFVFSAQLGYRKGDTVLRAGIIESRGGLAVDRFLRTDRLQLSAELWDFGRDNFNPHGKVYGQFQATPNIFVNGGLDDVLNPGTRSLFLGAGLRWKDEDIKNLLGGLSLLR